VLDFVREGTITLLPSRAEKNAWIQFFRVSVDINRDGLRTGQFAVACNDALAKVGGARIFCMNGE